MSEAQAARRAVEQYAQILEDAGRSLNLVEFMREFRRRYNYAPGDVASALLDAFAEETLVLDKDRKITVTE